MWSKTLQEQTIEHFKTMPMASMKQIGGTYGFCVYKDGQYMITDMISEEKYLFESMDALIKAKWAID